MLSNTDNMLSSEYMFNDNIPVTHLSELEKKLIVVLARSGPMTGYDFHLGGKPIRGTRKAMMSSASWDKIRKRLGPQGENLITNISMKGKASEDKRGRRKDLVWLTDQGVVLAFIEGVDLNILSDNVKKVYPNDAKMSLTVEVLKMGGKNMAKTAYLLTTGQYNKIEPSSIISPVPNEKEALNNFRRIIASAGKCPEFHKNLGDLRRGIKKMRKQMKGTVRQIGILEKVVDQAVEERKES
jgi:hypothetical protein